MNFEQKGYNWANFGTRIALKEPIDAIIFDFDGLILETEGPVFRSWQEIYRQFGLELPFERWAGIIGTSDAEHFNPFDDIEETARMKLDREALSAQRRSNEMSMIYKQQVMPGVMSYLNDAKAMGLKLGVASSSTHEWVDGHLERLGLIRYFDAIHCADDVAKTKPDPGLFLLALESLGASNHKAIVLEDSPNGVTAANRAGIFAVAVPNEITRSLNFEHADLKLSSLSEIPLKGLLERITGR